MGLKIWKNFEKIMVPWVIGGWPKYEENKKYL